MKRILNLNDFSGPALAVIGTLVLVIPGLLVIFSRVLIWLGINVPLLTRLARYFLIAGGVLLGLFFALVVAEQIQDHTLYRRYLRERGRQVDGECPYCGSRRIRSFEQHCPMCGEKLERFD